nr:reverse transcriptase domain-containing protein [Tanacetum cinerariifolium]
MSKQFTKSKRKRDDSWFKDKVLPVQAQANGQILHDEELAFLADLRITEVALMANLSHYGSDALAKVHNSDNVDTNLINQAMQAMPSSEWSNASTSSALLSNTVPNPKGEMKAVTTRSGLAYEGPSIPTNSPLEKVVKQNTEETMEKEHSNCQGSTAQVQPLVVPISILEVDVSRTQPKPTIHYPSRLNDQKLCEKATN